MKPTDSDTNIFRNFFEVMDFLIKKGWTFYDYTPHTIFETITYPGNRCVAAPMPTSPLFRGQSVYYDPCIPTLYRNPTNKRQRILNTLRIMEFQNILEEHPEIQETIANKFTVNYQGLAQHYGFATDLLDLTNNIWVAGFFATTDYQPQTDTYRPVLERIRKGVLYFLPMGGFPWIDMETSDLPSIMPIGQECLKRPGEQRAYSIRLSSGSNLNTYPGVLEFQFWHDSAVSLFIYNKFQQGKWLFPHDLMTKKAQDLKTTDTFSQKALELTLTSPTLQDIPPPEILSILQADNFHFVADSPFSYTPEELTYLQQESLTRIPNVISHLTFMEGPIQTLSPEEK